MLGQETFASREHFIGMRPLGRYVSLPAIQAKALTPNSIRRSDPFRFASGQDRTPPYNEFFKKPYFQEIFVSEKEEISSLSASNFQLLAYPHPLFYISFKYLLLSNIFRWQTVLFRQPDLPGMT